MFVGHSSEDGRTQAIYTHLTDVSEKCGEFASAFGAESVGKLIGLCHDIGKYSEAAQNRLLRGGPKTDHSTAGGQEIHKLCGAVGSYCVFGHHGGLPDGGSTADSGDAPTLFGRLIRKLPKENGYSAFSSEIVLEQPEEPVFSPMEQVGFSLSFLIRMLFSCLVDADFLDTEGFMTSGAISRGGYESIDELKAKLEKYLTRFDNPATEINKKRCEILESCQQAAINPKGLYSLTVPTGGGKTIASLAFALEHAKHNGLSRIIYVIPYTSIIEQTVSVFAGILGAENVLAHYADVDYSNDEPDIRDRKHLSAENWDAPVVVTTNVQFFESLFAARTSKCRKLHNIANSVIIFDEAQMIPLPYLRPCTRAIGELIHNFECTAVLCSATQPALDGFFPAEIKRREICADTWELYRFFRRTRIEHIGQISEEKLAERLSRAPQVLCIVNTRKQAQTIYSMLPEQGSFHLSTLMYPKHRKAVLDEIRQRLKNRLPCRVVATSLIEAGVDVDFPVVYRAEAGLASIIQAAGRCNREGKWPADESVVYVFKLDAECVRISSQEQEIAAFNMTSRVHGDDLASPEAIRSYFQGLYHIKGENLDKKDIVRRFEAGAANGGSFPFRSVAEEFKLIESSTHTVLIPIESEAKELAEQIRAGEHSRVLMRRIGRYCVNIYDRHFDELKAMGIIDRLDEKVHVLADISSYSDSTGLSLKAEGGKGFQV